MGACIAPDAGLATDESAEDRAIANQRARRRHTGACQQQRPRPPQLARLENHGFERSLGRRAESAQLVPAGAADRDGVVADDADQIAEHHAHGVDVHARECASADGGVLGRVARQRQRVHVERQPRHCRENAGCRKLDLFAGGNFEDEARRARGACAGGKAGAGVGLGRGRGHASGRLLGLGRVRHEQRTGLALVHRFLADVLERESNYQARRTETVDRPQVGGVCARADELAADGINRQSHEVRGSDDVDTDGGGIARRIAGLCAVRKPLKPARESQRTHFQHSRSCLLLPRHRVDAYLVLGRASILRLTSVIDKLRKLGMP